MIYLDNASTSWPKPECVYRAADDCLRGVGGNPGRGGHYRAVQASRLIYEARENIANLFIVSDSTRIAWMFSATDAFNTALFRLTKL